MKIVLVDVAEPRSGLGWGSWFDASGRFGMPAAGLVSLASLVRPHDQVSIHDERVSGPLHADQVDADLVGISVKSMFARRAYALADALRARGIKVVLGGVHASAQPDEAGAHADAVVVGEGEGVALVLDAIERGKHERIYRASSVPTRLDRLPPQRTDLLPVDGYMVHALQSARGCSFSCEFCPTRAVFGDGYRLRAFDSVLDDSQRLVEREPRPVFFTENVFGAGHLPFIEALTSGLHEARIPYAAICDWQAVNPLMIATLIRNGLGMVCINMTGRDEPQEEAAFKAFHDAGIPIWGYCMFGFEEDTPDVFEGAIDRARRYDLVCISPTVLAPYPGTPMATRLEREGRIFNHDTDLLDQHHVVFEPRNMTARDLEQGYEHVCRELASIIPFEGAIDALVNPQNPRRRAPKP